jgi:hypothetical protein
VCVCRFARKAGWKMTAASSVASGAPEKLFDELTTD